MERRPQRVQVFLIATAMSLLALLVSPSSPAHACSCALITLEQRIESATAVAVVKTTVPSEFPKGATLWTAEVIDVYKGTPSEEIVVDGGSPGSTCGHRELTAGLRLGVTIDGRNEAQVGGGCYGAIDIDALEALFSATEQPGATNGAAFVAGQDVPGARIGLAGLDGAPVAFGNELRDVEQIAGCPGGATFATVVTGPPPETTAAVVVRDVGTLEIRSERVISASLVDPWDTAPVTDLQCHTADGESVSYLIPRLPTKRQREHTPERADSVVHVWSGHERVMVPASTATSLSVDLANDAAFVIMGEEGVGVERWRVSTGRREAVIELEGSVAHDLAFDPGNTDLVVLARDNETRRVQLIRVEGDETTVQELGKRRRVFGILAVDDGNVAMAVGTRREVLVERRDRTGRLRSDFRTGQSSWSDPLMAGDDPVAVVVRGHLFVRGENLSPTSPRGMGWGEITALAALPEASLSIPLTVDTLPPRFERSEAPSEIIPAPTTEPEQAEPVTVVAPAPAPPAERSGWGPWRFVAGAFLAVVTALAIWRTRRKGTSARSRESAPIN